MKKYVLSFSIAVILVGLSLGCSIKRINTEPEQLPVENEYQWSGYYGSIHRGIEYLKKNQFDLAEKEFRGCLNQRDGNPAPGKEIYQELYALYNLACTYSRQGKTDRAIKYLKEAIKRDLAQANGGLVQ